MSQPFWSGDYGPVDLLKVILPRRICSGDYTFSVEIVPSRFISRGFAPAIYLVAIFPRQTSPAILPRLFFPGDFPPVILPRRFFFRESAPVIIFP